MRRGENGQEEKIRERKEEKIRQTEREREREGGGCGKNFCEWLREGCTD